MRNMFLVLALLLGLCAVPARAQEMVPHNADDVTPPVTAEAAPKGNDDLPPLADNEREVKRVRGCECTPGSHNHGTQEVVIRIIDERNGRARVEAYRPDNGSVTIRPSRKRGRLGSRGGHRRYRKVAEVSDRRASLGPNWTRRRLERQGVRLADNSPLLRDLQSSLESLAGRVTVVEGRVDKVEGRLDKVETDVATNQKAFEKHVKDQAARDSDQDSAISRLQTFYNNAGDVGSKLTHQWWFNWLVLVCIIFLAAGLARVSRRVSGLGG